MSYKRITIAEFELSDDAVTWLRENTAATMNEQETSDHVLDLNRDVLLKDLAYMLGLFLTKLKSSLRKSEN